MQLELRMTGDPALAHAHSAAPSDRGLVHHGGGGAELGNGAEGGGHITGSRQSCQWIKWWESQSIFQVLNCNNK